MSEKARLDLDPVQTAYLAGVLIVLGVYLLLSARETRKAELDAAKLTGAIETSARVISAEAARSVSKKPTTGGGSKRGSARKAPKKAQ